MPNRGDRGWSLVLTMVYVGVAATAPGIVEAQPAGCVGGGYATLADKEAGIVQGCDGPPTAGRYQSASILGFEVERLDLSVLDLRFDGAEIEALNGATIPTLGERVTGGVTLGVGGRLARWARLPEVRVTLGGAAMPDEPWTPLAGQHRGLSTRVTSLFQARLDVSVGAELPLRLVRPYLLGRVAASFFVLGADVRDDRLGVLGQETVSDFTFDVGTEVGLAFILTDQLALQVGWRATWYGAEGYGISVSLTGARSLR